MRILVVSGFLGAGKTTFIQELARRAGHDFVVYENECGQADIDAKVLAQNEELSVWESTENCICCSGKKDFATSILTIANTLDPEYLVVEPTGVARLSSILENIDKVSYERVGLLQPIALVDALVWDHQKDQFEDIYLDQVKTAPVVILTKLEGRLAEDIAPIVSWVKEINPGAEVIDKPYKVMDDAWFSELLDRVASGDSASGGVAAREATQSTGLAADDFETLSLQGIQLPSPSHLIWFLDALSSGLFGSIVRAKGYLPCGSQWVRFDMVDTIWSITGMDEVPEDSQGVFIGTGLHRSWLREVLAPLLQTGQYFTGANKFRK